MIRFTGSGADSLLFPGRDGGHLPPSTLRGAWSAARKAGGREDLRWHDLRHVGAVLTAQTGATLVEIMGRLRHGTPNAALRYQHIALDADARVAANLSLLAGGGQILPFGSRDRRASGA
jgi:integrase